MQGSGNNLLQNLLLPTVLLLLLASCQPAESEYDVTTSDPSPGQSGGIGKIAVYQPNPRYFQDPDGNPLFLVGPYTFCGPLDLLERRSNYYRLGVDGVDSPLYEPSLRRRRSGSMFTSLSSTKFL
jgi:hypothetical protein